MVSSLTRNARAISGVDSPPSARRVSATRASGASAGWQQRKISSRRSSGTTVTGTSAGCGSSAELLGEGAVAAEPVDGPVAAGRHQPRPRVVRRSVDRPAAGGDRERLLCGVLGDVDVAAEADQRGDHARPLGAEDLVEQVRRPRPAGPRPTRPCAGRGSARRWRARRPGRRPRRGSSRRTPPWSRRTGRR